jgi:hypothetical protein
MNKIVYLFLVCTLYAFGCQTKVSTNIPKKRPDDLQLDCFVGGGMAPESQRYTIYKDSAVFETYFQGIRNRWKFEPDQVELDALWKTVLDNDFTSIKTRNEGQVHDRGGVNIDISFGAQHYGINDSGSDFVEEKDQPKFSAVYEAITRFVVDGLKKQEFLQHFILRLGMASDSVESLGIQVDDRSLWSRNKEKKEALPDTLTANLRPGKYLLNGWGNIFGTSLSLHQTFTTDSLSRYYEIHLNGDSTWVAEVIPAGKTYTIILDRIDTVPKPPEEPVYYDE